MRVGVDGRTFLRRGGGRGIALYTGRVLAGMAGAGDDFRVLVPGRGEIDAPPGVTVRRTRLPSRALYASAALLRRPRLDRLTGPCDVAWAPSVGPVALSPDVPLVLTVHDLSFELRPGELTAYERAFHRAARPRELARRAQRVITVSESVREQVLERWGLDPDRVVTVRSGPGRPPVREPVPPPPGLPGGYVLAVGALEPRKQPELLVKAHALARAQGLRAGLVLAGDGPLRPRLEGGEAVLTGHVGDAEIDGLFTGALCLACVSSDEGFGFTPLEAASRGVPAVVSDLGPFAETLGDAALTVPTGDPEALADALLRIERDPVLRERLATAGAAAAAALSWEHTASQTRRVLAEAAAG